VIPRNRGGLIPRLQPIQALNAGGPVLGAATAVAAPERILVAGEHTAEQILAGGRSAFLRHLRDNATEARAALGLG
jgi:hypothetical protein